MPGDAHLAVLENYPFTVRYSTGRAERARVSADLIVDAYGYLSGLLGGTRPEFVLLILDEADWLSTTTPYGLPYFTDELPGPADGIVMSATAGGFWRSMTDDLGLTDAASHAQLTGTYPSGPDGVDLQPFFDLVTVHELGHAFEAAGRRRFPTLWLAEIFVNLTLHAFVATRRPADMPTLEVLPTLGAHSDALARTVRSAGYHTLDELEDHYPGSDASPMGPLNYVWYQYRWQRIAAEMFAADGEAGLVRFWDAFPADRADTLDDGVTASDLAPVLADEVSQTLGRAVAAWD